MLGHPNKYMHSARENIIHEHGLSQPTVAEGRGFLFALEEGTRALQNLPSASVGTRNCLESAWEISSDDSVELLVSSQG